MRGDIVRGTLLAVLAAVSFGATTPFVERAGRGAGAFATAALLYAGACISAMVLRAVSAPAGAALGRGQYGRLLAVALFGAAVAPSLLAWGLQRAGATMGALLLTLEAPFTVLLARVAYREHIGRRVLVALGIMALGGAALALDAAWSVAFSLIGALAVAGASLGWALDNTLTRRLADHDPLSVVAGKAALGAAMTGTLAAAAGDTLPATGAALVLLGCGATGYGLSLRLYLLAQRRLGAARTASIFAVAPFMGAALAWALGERGAGPLTALSATLFALGVYLHATERHRHAHVHAATVHEHLHRHDDGHHDHVHDPPFTGEHSHPHAHDRIEHDHEHAADEHHDHRHA